ncbi:ladinin-1 isoform X2 [Nelusetta ayraudi]|uniref:ladinin-1 isoform X2 n=1 Tax=Nelusetta ayraudi TaxID=303726 RepID=UPI003F72BB94
MSISRKNWSALSSLARQWTVEDEEEVEREKRRRERDSGSTAEAESTVSPTPSQVASRGEATGDVAPGDVAPGDVAPGDEAPRDRPAHIEEDPADTTDSSPQVFQATSSAEQLQVDFVEMLRVRSEKRRQRHVEVLQRQKQEEEEEEEVRGGTQEVKDGEPGDEVFSPSSKPQSPRAAASRSPDSRRTDTTQTQHENEESKDPETKPPSNRTRKFVSSVAISLDQSASSSGCTSPTSPRSPTPPSSPQGWEPTSPPASVQNGHTEEDGSSTCDKSEQSSKPALARHSSRTISFRMMRKKEEETSPLQRSASVRVASKKFEGSPDQIEDEDKPSSFQRNARQRISARSIQEKMERLAHAAQKLEPSRPTDVAHRTLHRLDRVSMKRGLFEKESQAATPISPGPSRHEFKNLSSGVSDRISRWVSKAKDQAVTSHGAADVRHVNINSRRSLFENASSNSNS